MSSQKGLNFFVVYWPSGFLQNKILLQFLELETIIIAGATMQFCRASRYMHDLLYFGVFGFATVVQRGIYTLRL